MIDNVPVRRAVPHAHAEPGRTSPRALRVGRGHASDREATSAARRVRLHRRWCGGRTLARDATSASFAEYEFQPRVLRDVSNLDTSTTLFGRSMSMPLILAPTGYTRIADSQGRAGSGAGRRSSRDPLLVVDDGDPLDRGSGGRVATATSGSRSTPGGIAASSRSSSDRAKDAGYTTVWLTVDTAVLGRRERDVRRGFTLPPKIGPSTLIDGAIHPGWTLDFLRNEPITFANVVGRHEMDGSTAISLAEQWPISSISRCPGTTSTGCGRSGTGRSCSRGSRPSPTPSRPSRWVWRASACRTTAAVSSTMPLRRFDLVEPVRDEIGDGCDDHL